ncbi:hypothetical protein OKW21_002150 [Catalinimonas alkaloidigena]|uniref:DUF4097 family beta strand repeat-containing protein n=1 Tax=Catalinimonas alkaloidigena TaxID=1075417 RepID=UPI0024051C2D|nr:DUF4097 family beta strand repeat-containing protein [Catalinimonas alkaloidigena]MDF9796887.1 hypothetical protein [Catalinimonas alkaloidigena]
MKVLPILLMTYFVFHSAIAQQYTASFDSNTNSNILHLMIEGGEIIVEGYAGKDVVIVADGYEAPPEKARGLTALYANGRQDNSGLGLSVTREGSKMQLISVGHQDIDYTIKIPDQTSILLQAGPQNDDIIIRNLKGEIELKAHSDDVELEGISGPVVANSISGNIKLSFDEVNTHKPTAISVVSGDVDIFLPSQTKADFKLSSVSGEVYTDFDLSMNSERDENRKRNGMRKPIHGSINGGGVPIQISTVSGNIYLRKQE